MLRVAFALSFWWIVPVTAGAQPMAEAAAHAAGRSASLLQRRTTVSVEFQNLTTLAPAESSNFRSALEDELRKAGLTPAAQPEVRLRASISENVRGLLFVVEILSGENRQVVVLPWSAPPLTEEKPRLKLTRKPMWEQAEPVLDFLLLDDLLVLSPAKVSTYRLVDGKWISAGAASVSLARPAPRDPRGHIENAPSGIRVYVPGTTCNGPLQPALKFTCVPTNEPWLVTARDSAIAVRWVTDRNLLEADGVRGAFFSAANGLFAASDGRIRDHAGEPLASSDAWGSDLAGIANPCGAGATLLAVTAGDSQERDQVQAYEIARGQAAPLSEPMDLAGPGPPLWPNHTPAPPPPTVAHSKHD